MDKKDILQKFDFFISSRQSRQRELEQLGTVVKLNHVRSGVDFPK